ncbi:inositol monophosphatase family protein [Maricaulis salignorans]|uniref:Fructose-1,6-bisphosphatase n=1 Tax=Maricaulis salignorans TaxID=144026 RepID=A0A1G9QQK7_9PROT|nr:inositol monophosphatase [Maricaulis salignorans]SDM13253.1 fructose-1,6-bisphosphatase [Maricaulis salignorans]
MAASGDLRAILAAAEDAARAAGQALRKGGGAFEGVERSEGRDIKLNADRAAERLIIDRLTALMPAPILSEETGWTAEAGDKVWVVDPLDGSANYNRNIDLCSVSIAWVENGRPVAGVIYEFLSDRLYSGAIGLGTRLNGEPVSVAGHTRTQDSILFTGLAINRDFSAEALGAFAAGFACWKKVRMIGSAATSLAYVARGAADAYFEDSIMFWDVAAGCALVEAAGGRVSIVGDSMDKPVSVHADNGKLWTL